MLYNLILQKLFTLSYVAKPFSAIADPEEFSILYSVLTIPCFYWDFLFISTSSGDWEPVWNVLDIKMDFMKYLGFSLHAVSLESRSSQMLCFVEQPLSFTWPSVNITDKLIICTKICLDLHWSYEAKQVLYPSFSLQNL